MNALVDTNGHELVSEQEKRKRRQEELKEKNWKFIKEIVEKASITGGIVVAVSGLINYILATVTAAEYSKFFGMDRKYFSNIEIAKSNIVYVIVSIILFLLIIIFAIMKQWIEKRLPSESIRRLYAIFFFLITVYAMFGQNVMHIQMMQRRFHTIKMLNSYKINGLLVIYLILDIYLAWQIICNEKKCWTTFLFRIAIILFCINIISGIITRSLTTIKDKVDYETIDDIEGKKAIITEYEDYFVLMKCEIQGNMLILKKGSYSLETKEGKVIDYKEYEKVKVE